jgi:hypothetical protein
MTKKMRHSGRLLVVALFLSSAMPAVTRAQKPAPTVAQDDPDFAEFVKKATTKPEFLSPLVDHLPKKAGVPTPKDVLGYHIGTEKKLTYVADQQRYFRALEKALPGRVKTEVTGKTEEGRDVMVVYVTSEANLKNLEANRQNTKRLADPRGLTDAQAQQLIASTKPHYHISAGLHSGETNPPEAVIELAYRLAVSDEPYIKQIRDNVIVSITGATDVDGRDRYVDWYYAYKIDEPYEGGENYGGPPYWGKYVFHDNNRDINYGVDSLRVHLNWYLNWVPPIWHDLHEAQTLLYTFSGQPPQNANLDPILYTELPFFATYEVNKLTSYGMPGVWHFGFVEDVRDLQSGRRQHQEGHALRRTDTAAVVPPESGAGRRCVLVDPKFDQLRRDRCAHRARAHVEVPVDGRRELLQEITTRNRQTR